MKISKYNLLVEQEDGKALLFNTRTGALIKLSNNRKIEYHSIINSTKIIHTEFTDFLFKENFIVNNDIDELSLIRNRYNKAYDEKSLYSITVMLTENCNFRCKYCYQQHRTTSLTDDAKERILLFLEKKANIYNSIHINWFGGEPLLEVDKLISFSKEIENMVIGKNKKISQYITTNGYLLTHDTAKKLSNNGISNIQITIDGYKNSHDIMRPHANGHSTYETCLNNATNAIKENIYVIIRVNLSPLTEIYIDKLIKDLKRMGFNNKNCFIHLCRTVDHGNINNNLKIKTYTIKEYATVWIKTLKILAENNFQLPTLYPKGYNCIFDLPHAIVAGPTENIQHCSSASNNAGFINKNGDVNINEHYKIKKNDPTIDVLCSKCKVLPQCMGGCSYLKSIGQESCNPEKYVMQDLVLLVSSKTNKPSTKGE